MKFNRLKHIAYLILVLLLPMFSFGNDQAALFANGNAAYAKGQFKMAIDDYLKIVDSGYQSAAVYFNLGNAYFKTGDVSSALLYYEKAHKLAPGDEDINANIQFANTKTTDKIEETPEFFVNRWWRSFTLAFSLNLLSVLSILLILLGSGALVAYFFANSPSIKRASFYSAMLLFILGVFTVFIGGVQSSYFSNNQQAIIFSNSVNVKSGPVEKSGTLFVLHDGTKVNILENSDDWIKIRLANGNEGWIKTPDVKKI